MKNRERVNWWKRKLKVLSYLGGNESKRLNPEEAKQGGELAPKSGHMGVQGQILMKRFFYACSQACGVPQSGEVKC